MKHAWLFLILLGPRHSGQDASTVVDALDAKLGDFKDATCSITTTELRLYLNVRPNAPARLVIRRDGDAELRCALYDGTIFEVHVDFAMRVTKDGFSYEIQPAWQEMLTPKRAMCIRARTSFADLQGADPLLLPTFYPIRLFMDDSLLFYSLAPKRYFGLEKDLVLLPPRADGTTVLGSKTTVKEPIKALGIPFVVAAPIEKRWYVKDGRIDRMWMRIDLGKSGYAAMMVSTVAARDAGGRPTKILMSLSTLYQGRPQLFDPVERIVAYDAVNTGVVVSAPSADDVAYADAALKPSSAYGKKKDATSLASLAAHRLWIRSMIKSIFMVDLGPVEEEKAIEALEALRELRPKDEFIPLNLLPLHHGSEKGKALIKDVDLPATSWKAVKAAAAGEGFSEQRLTAVLSAGGVDLKTATVDQWKGVLAMFDADEVSAWATKTSSTPAGLHIALYAKMGFESGVAHLLRAIELEPRNDGWAVSVAGSLLVTKTPSEAAIKTAAALGDASLDALVLLRDGKKEEARTKAKEAEKLAAASLAHARNLTSVYAGLDDYESAMRSAKRLAALAVERGTWELGSDGPMRLVAEMAVARKDAYAVAELVAPFLQRYPWVANSYLDNVPYQAVAEAWAADHASEGAKVALVAKVAASATFTAINGVAVLRAALAKSETREVTLALAEMTADPAAAMELYQKSLAAGAPASAIIRAIYCAGKAEKTDVAAGFLKLLPALTTAAELENASQAALAAGDFDAALRFARAMEDHARRPFILYGLIAEARKDPEDAIRWYTRDMKEAADPFEPYTGAVEFDIFGRFSARTNKLLASDLRKKLMAALGEEYFLKKLLEAKHEPLAVDEEKKARDAFAALSSDDLGARDEAEETLLKAGRRVTPIIKAGLDSTDSDLKERVRRILAKLAEPQ